MAFTPPIGTLEERATGEVWPGKWFDATGYLTLYSQGYHTGADLNLNFPHFDTNAHSEVVAMGDGTVTFAQLFSTKEWGNLVVIDHGMVDGKPLFSRYGHVEDILVSAGQTVSAGESIASVGNGEGLFPYHLHFDISNTDRLRDKPGHWPGAVRAQVLAHYVDPKEWLQIHVTDGLVGRRLPSASVWYVTASFGLRVREAPGTSSRQVGSLAFGDRVIVVDDEPVDQDTYSWGRIKGGMFNGDFFAMGKSDQSEMYVARNPPGSRPSQGF